MTVPTALMRHAERVDYCLRRVLDALLPFHDAIREGARHPMAAPIMVAARGVDWLALSHALAQAEPWPFELLGPITVQWCPADEPESPPRLRPAWFTPGHHPSAHAVEFLRVAARREGMTLLERNIPANGQAFHTWFLPPDPAAGRAMWTAGASVRDLASVPVTVWVPAEGTSPAMASGAVPPPGPIQEAKP